MSLPEKAKQFWSSYIAKNAQALEEGLAFSQEKNLSTQLLYNFSLIEILKKIDVDTTIAELSFWKKYNQITEEASENSSILGKAEAIKVKLLVSQEKLTEAYIAARSIQTGDAAGNPDTPSFLKGFEEIFLMANKIDALKDIAQYHVDSKQYREALLIAQEIKALGDTYEFSAIYKMIALNPDQNNPELLQKLADELEHYLTLLEQSQDGDDVPFIEIFFIKDVITALLNQDERTPNASSSMNSEADMNAWSLPVKKIPKALNAALKKNESLEFDDSQREKAEILASITATRKTPRNWHAVKGILRELLSKIANEYFEEYANAMGPDGENAGEETVVEVGYVSLKRKTQDAELPSEVYYFKSKMELAYASLVFGDIDFLEQLVADHFSIQHTVYFFSDEQVTALISNL